MHLRRSLHEVAAASSVGIITGVLVGGVAGRLAMRAIAATSDPALRGTLTSDDEPVGEITLDGTIGLVLFVGVLGGLLLGLAYLVLRRLLPDDLRWRAATYAVLVWCVGAASMFDPADFDFRVLEPGWLAVAMFSAIFLAAGWINAAGVEVALRSWPPPGRSSWWRYLPLVATLPLFPILGIAVLLALIRGSGLGERVGGAVSGAVVVAGRVALVVGALLLAVPAVSDVVEIV